MLTHPGDYTEEGVFGPYRFEFLLIHSLKLIDTIAFVF